MENKVIFSVKTYKKAEEVLTILLLSRVSFC